MSRDLCEREDDVVQALGADGVWPADLVAHVATCPVCQHTRDITAGLLEVLQEETATPLPDASRIWWRAELAARGEARRRALAPIDRAERAEPLIALVAVVFIWFWRGDVVMRAIGRIVGSDATGPAAQAALPALVGPVLMSGLMLMALMLIAGLAMACSRD